MRAPNLMVGLSSEVLARLLTATAEHGGEVARNPYHLTLPTRLMDNVRRGSEVMGTFGVGANPFLFAELYRISIMKPHTHDMECLPQRVMSPNRELCFEGLTLL